MAGFLTAAVAAIGSTSIGSALVRIAVAYGVSRLINRATGAGNQTQVDQGIRLQLQPNTTNPIPLLYGSAYYAGNITDAQLSNSNKTMWACLTLSEHSTTNKLSDNAAVETFFDEVYYNDQRVTFKADGITVDYVTNSDGTVDTSPRDLVKIYLYRNGSNAPALPVGITATLPPAAHTLFPGWDSTWTMTNLTFALVRIDYNRDKGITGIPNLRFKISNTLYRPGDAIYDYLRNSVSGCGLTNTEIDTASLIALNDYADDEVNFFNEDTGTVLTLADRYQVNGIINPQQAVLDNLQELANSAGVYINYDITTGKWGVIVDRDAAPVHNFNDSNIVGGIDVTATSLDTMYNAVQAEFPSRLIQDQTDSIRITLPTEFLNDNEPENVLNIRFTMLNEPVQARALAYLALYQNRQDRVVTFTTDYSKINVAAGEVITLTNSVYGFVNQTFRVVRVREVEGELGELLIEIVAQEYDSTLYTAQGQPRRPRTPSAALTLPSLGVIATPAAPLVTTANNNRQPSILLTGTVPTGVVDRFEFWSSTDNFATSTLIHEEKNSNGSPFNSSTTILARIATLPAGSYKFKVRAGNEQAYSDYSPATTELVWAPVQTTDEVSADTKFSVSDLLPILAAGAIAYFAYKALYPELLKALSNTQLGELLGIEDPEEAAAAAEQLEQESSAFRIVTVAGTEITPLTDNNLTFVAGDGIELSANATTNEITITATGGAAAGVSSLNSLTGALNIVGGTGIEITATGTTITLVNTCCDDEGIPELPVPTPVDPGVLVPGRILDNCEITATQPPSAEQRADKEITIPEVPAKPVDWVYITGSGTWYDDCYQTTVPTIKITNRKDVFNVAVGSSINFTGLLEPVTTGTIDWKIGYLENKGVTLKRVSDTDYICLKNWNSADGSAIVTPDSCSLDPSSRPLFPSVDYPNGHEFGTFANLDDVLFVTDSTLRFLYIAPVAAIPPRTEIQNVVVKPSIPGQTIVIRQARRCPPTYRKLVGYKPSVVFDGVVSGNLLYTAENLEVGTYIMGGATAADTTERFSVSVKIIEKLTGSYLLETSFSTKTDTTSANYTGMRYRAPLYQTVAAADEPALDYNVIN